MSGEDIGNRIANIIYTIVPTLYLFIGTATNLLSVLVYSKKHMRKTSYSLYLLELAVVDMFVILIGNGRYAFESYFGVDIRDKSLLFCKVHKFLTYFFLQLSSCLLSMLSIDRFFGVVFVLKAFTFNRKKKILAQMEAQMEAQAQMQMAQSNAKSGKKEEVK